METKYARKWLIRLARAWCRQATSIAAPNARQWKSRQISTAVVLTKGATARLTRHSHLVHETEGDTHETSRESSP
jgi:hypothetical protein